MASKYEYLGALRVLGQSDATVGYQFNTFLPGTGWDVLVSAWTAKQSAIAVGQWPVQQEFECYQIYIDGPVGANFRVSVNRFHWNFVIQGWQNYNDPTQVLHLRDGDEVQFEWTVAFAAGPYTPSGGANVQPEVTMWFRAER